LRSFSSYVAFSQYLGSLSAAVVSMEEWAASAVEWVGLATEALLARDFAGVVGEDIGAHTIRGTALAFRATGVTTALGGVILIIMDSLIIILTRLIHTHFLILTHIMVTGMCTPGPIILTARSQMEGHFI
jgi:hypothetical protein